MTLASCFFWSEPSFGHYNKDSVLDVVIEEDAGNNSKRVRSATCVTNNLFLVLLNVRYKLPSHSSTNDSLEMIICCLFNHSSPHVQVVILDGVSGGVLWEVPLLATPNSPRPASIHTTNGYSIFVFWGLKTENTSVSALVLLQENIRCSLSLDANLSENTCFQLLTSDRRIYMLHPVYSKVLLEATSSAEHIVKFKGDYFIIWTFGFSPTFSQLTLLHRFLFFFFIFNLSHAARARTPRCLHPADGSRGGGCWRHCFPQQVEAEAGCPS